MIPRAPFYIHILVSIFIATGCTPRENDDEIPKGNAEKSIDESAWWIVQDYYPGWSGHGDSNEVWARRLSKKMVEIVVINRTIDSMNLPSRRGIWIRYTVDTSAPGVIVKEENIGERDWKRNEYHRIK